jgi:hypothetical protein
MSWISAADLAKRTGVSRAAVTQAIKKGRIPADAVRRAGGRVLVDEASGLKAILKRANAPTVEHQAPPPMVPADTAELASLFAWGSAAELAPPAPDVSHLEHQIRQLQHRLACTQQREQEWLKHYEDFRDWILNIRVQGDRATRGGWDDKDLCMALWLQLGDQPAIGDVMVMIKEQVIAHLARLDKVSLASRFPSENRST